MVIPVDPEQIEGLVGAKRLDMHHIARAASEKQIVFILHSQACLDSRGRDGLVDCRYSKALDRGIDMEVWEDWQDKAVLVLVKAGRLVPNGEAPQ